jgi:serine/threonine protein kinase
LIHPSGSERAAPNFVSPVHRDWKPESLFVSKDGRVRIRDFGLAKLTQAQAATGDGPTFTLPEGTDPDGLLGNAGYISAISLYAPGLCDR